jgi:hypothetical protein
MFRQSGFSYTETLLAVTVLGLAIVPALDALHGAFTGSAVQRDVVIWQQQLATRLEGVLAEPFAVLEAAAGDETVPSAYSDAAGSADRMLVYVSSYDADNADGDDDPFTAKDAGIVWVRVAFANAPYALETVIAK